MQIRHCNYCNKEIILEKSECKEEDWEMYCNMECLQNHIDEDLE